MRDLVRSLGKIAAAGAEGVLLREPALTDSEFLSLAKETREIFRGGWVGVHDRIHVAIAAGADAVHLGFRSLSPEVTTALVPTGVATGHSHHAPDHAVESMVADYRFLGPVYRTASKDGWVEPLGLPPLEGIPLARTTWAIGGIVPGNVRAVLDTGVGGVAAIGSVFGVDDAEEGMAAMLQAAGVDG